MNSSFALSIGVSFRRSAREYNIPEYFGADRHRGCDQSGVETWAIVRVAAQGRGFKSRLPQASSAGDPQCSRAFALGAASWMRFRKQRLFSARDDFEWLKEHAWKV